MAAFVLPLFRAIAGIGIAYLTRVAFLNAGTEAFTPYLARVRTLCVFAFAVNANLVAFALLVLAALLAAFWLLRVIIFVATLLAVFADVIAIAAVNDLDDNNVFAFFATTTFDGD